MMTVKEIIRYMASQEEIQYTVARSAYAAFDWAKHIYDSLESDNGIRQVSDDERIIQFLEDECIAHQDPEPGDKYRMAFLTGGRIEGYFTVSCREYPRSPEERFDQYYVASEEGRNRKWFYSRNFRWMLKQMASYQLAKAMSWNQAESTILF